MSQISLHHGILLIAPTRWLWQGTHQTKGTLLRNIRSRMWDLWASTLMGFGWCCCLGALSCLFSMHFGASWCAATNHRLHFRHKYWIFWCPDSLQCELHIVLEAEQEYKASESSKRWLLSRNSIWHVDQKAPFLSRQLVTLFLWCFLLVPCMPTGGVQCTASEKWIFGKRNSSIKSPRA